MQVIFAQRQRHELFPDSLHRSAPVLGADHTTKHEHLSDELSRTNQIHQIHMIQNNIVNEIPLARENETATYGQTKVETTLAEAHCYKAIYY